MTSPWVTVSAFRQAWGMEIDLFPVATVTLPSPR